MTVSRTQSRWAYLLVALISLGWYYAGHQWQPVVEPDSVDYTAFDWSTPEAVLSSKRTCGYPLFLGLIRAVSDDPRAIPLAHWLALAVAALVFLEGLVAAGYRRRTALVCAVTLLFGRGIMEFGPFVLADSLASSLAIAAAGCFLASTASPPRRIAWCGLVGLTFWCYQTRPAYLFLVPLWPVASVAVDRLILRRDAGWRSSLQRGARYAAATLIPFILFCTLRWAVVGHWGLVSFSGYNLIGVVGQFLDQQSADALPAELQPIARDMLEKRSQWATYEPPTSFLAMERMFNPTVWRMAVPTIQERHGDNTVVVDRVLSQLAGSLLRQHPREYATWLIWNAIHAVKQVVLLTATDHGTGLLCLLFVLAHAFALWRGPPADCLKPAAADSCARQQSTAVRFRELHLLFWTAVAFTAAKTLLVILVEPANDRYMTGAMPLLPAALAVFLVHALESRGERGD